MSKLPPLVFSPVLKRIRWGGRRLGDLLHKPIGSDSDYAESWEVADHADGTSVVSDGPLTGRTLRSLVEEFPADLMGPGARPDAAFPLLIKFLDANDWLSLQVHPDDRLAETFRPGEQGKTEAWVIMDAAPDSRICAGLKPEVTELQLRQGLESGRIEPLLNIIPVVPGDCIFVPAGTVHALGPGILLAEIQQQSNLTFRLHDWGRVDSQGRPRQLHPEESVRCTDFRRGPVMPVVPSRIRAAAHLIEELVRCEHFVIRRHRSDRSFAIRSDPGFRIIIVLDGDGRISWATGELSIQTGRTVLLPACSDLVTLTPRSGQLTVLEVFRESE